MFRILDRYILREVAQTWLAVTGVLLFILLSNQFARVLGEAAVGHIPKDTVFKVLGLTSVQYLTILIPVGLLLSIMLALARFYRDSEMTAITGSGVGPARIYRPLMVFAATLAVLVGYLSLIVSPRAAAEMKIIQETGMRATNFAGLEAGKFAEFGDGDALSTATDRQE